MAKKLTHPSSKVIATYEMLKDGKPMKFDNFVKQLGCKPVTAMVLICCLRRDFGADIETIRDGRKVEFYQLKNAADLASKMVSTKASRAAKVLKSKAVKTPKVAVTKMKSTVTRTTKNTSALVPTIDTDFDVC